MAIFQVVHVPFVFVRQGKTLSSAKISFKLFGTCFHGVLEGHWVRLCDEPGYVLRDGQSAGLKGRLVEEAVASSEALIEVLGRSLKSTGERREASECERWTALACVPTRDRPGPSGRLSGIALAGNYVWVALDGAPPGWRRFVEPPGFAPADIPLHFECVDVGATADLWAQARLAVAQALGGDKALLDLRRLFDGWEGEPVPTLAALHRDVVLWAQHRVEVLSPSQVPPDGSIILHPQALADLHKRHFTEVRNFISSDLVAACLAEATALDDAESLKPTPLHRALGDRTDSILGLDEASAPPALARLCAGIRALARPLRLKVPTTSMLACYAPGTFYRRHLDSALDDPRRITAIVYLLPPDWTPADGGDLLWWPPLGLRGTQDDEPRCYHPSPGSLVLFNATTVPHEVTPPTSRRRFAVRPLSCVLPGRELSRRSPSGSTLNESSCIKYKNNYKY